MRSHALPGFISDTRAIPEKSEVTLPRLEVSYINENGAPAKQSFDMQTREGRHFQNRFMLWILKNNLTFTGYAAK